MSWSEGVAVAIGRVANWGSRFLAPAMPWIFLSLHLNLAPGVLEGDRHLLATLGLRSVEQACRDRFLVLGVGDDWRFAPQWLLGLHA